VLRQTIGWNPERKSDALDAWKIQFYIEALGEGPPLLAGNLIRGVEKSRSTKKDLFVCFQPVIDLGPNFIAREYELPLRQNIHIRFHVKGGEGGEDNGSSQDNPCRPNSLAD
jgi:hypothetical protein